MSKLGLGAVGVVVGSPGDADVFLEAAAALRALAYSTIWLAGPQIARLEAIGQVLDATRDVKVGTGIISVDQFDAAAVAAAFTGFQARHPARLVVGLGGAHGPQPLRTLTAYLDALDSLSPTVPPSARVLGALGPRMLQLARDRAAGGYPLLVTPDYTVRARSLLGQDATLVVGQFVVVETDPDRARQAGRGPLRFMTRPGSGYAANLRRMGFGDDEISGLSDQLVDAVVAWGDVEAIAARIGEHLQAGADHVALSALHTGPPGSLPVDQWRQLAAMPGLSRP
jgi:probable F420-dependent oxidoreductase